MQIVVLMLRRVSTTVLVYLLLLLLSLTLTTPLDVRSAYCNIYVGQTYKPNILSSFVGKPTLAKGGFSVEDCTLACFNTDPCRTVTFDSRSQMCLMYLADVDSPRHSLSLSPEITTISIPNKNQREFLHRFVPISCPATSDGRGWVALQVPKTACRISHKYSSFTTEYLANESQNRRVVRLAW